MRQVVKLMSKAIARMNQHGFNHFTGPEQQMLSEIRLRQKEKEKQKSS